MRNLYNITTSLEALRITTSLEALRALIRAFRDVARWNDPSIDIYPNTLGPVVRVAADGERELTMLKWGMPSPPERIKGKADYGQTNIRNPTYAHWLPYLGVERRCVVPATSFAEPSPTPNDKDPETGVQKNFWFALDESRPPFFFAGLWTPWHGVRKVKDGPQDHELYGFFTTHPNGVVKPISRKGDAGDPDQARGDRHLAAGAMDRGEGAAAAAARRSTCHRRQAGDADQVSSDASARSVVLDAAN